MNNCVNQDNRKRVSTDAAIATGVHVLGKEAGIYYYLYTRTPTTVVEWSHDLSFAKYFPYTRVSPVRYPYMYRAEGIRYHIVHLPPIYTSSQPRHLDVANGFGRTPYSLQPTTASTKTLLRPGHLQETHRSPPLHEEHLQHLQSYRRLQGQRRCAEYRTGLIENE